jgi:hypothetical protein
MGELLFSEVSLDFALLLPWEGVKKVDQDKCFHKPMADE